MQGGNVAGGLGLDREFFESILVPQVMIYGFLGLHPTSDGFRLNPNYRKTGLNSVLPVFICTKTSSVLRSATKWSVSNPASHLEIPSLFTCRKVGNLRTHPNRGNLTTLINPSLSLDRLPYTGQFGILFQPHRCKSRLQTRHGEHLAIEDRFMSAIAVFQCGIRLESITGFVV